MAQVASKSEHESWVRPAHSGFEAPTIGEVYDPKEHVGEIFYDKYGNTCVVTEGGGSQVIKNASPTE